MEIWQYLLMGLTSAVGLIIGFFIGKFTHSEVVYAQQYIRAFGALSLVFGIAGVVFGIYSFSEYVVPGFCLLFLGLLSFGSLIATRWHK